METVSVLEINSLRLDHAGSGKLFFCTQIEAEIFIRTDAFFVFLTR